MSHVKMIMICPECEREFDLLDETEADEWYAGHDCETVVAAELAAQAARELSE